MALLKKPDRVKSTGHALYADGTQMKRVTRFSADATMTNEDLLELSNAGVAERIEDVDTVSTTVEAHECGSTDNWKKALNMYRYGSDSDNNSAIGMTDASFETACVDFTLQVTSGTNNDALAYTSWYGGQWLTGYSANFTVDGNATETFNFEGEHKRNFLNAYRDVRVLSGTYEDTSTIKIVGTDIGSGYTGRVVTVDGEIVLDASSAGGSNTITLTTSSSDTDVTGSPALDIRNGQRFRVVYAKDSPDSFSELSSTPDGLAGLRKGMVDIYLRRYDGAMEKTLRVQSVGIDISLDRDEKNQLGSNTAYSRSLNRPIDVSMSVEAFTSDLEEWAKFANKETTFDNDSLNEIDITEMTNDTVLIVDMYNSENPGNHVNTGTNFLKKYVVSGLSLASDTIDITAGEDGTTSWAFSADNFTVVSSGNTTFL